MKLTFDGSPEEFAEMMVSFENMLVRKSCDIGIMDEENNSCMYDDVDDVFNNIIYTIKNGRIPPKDKE